MTSWFVLMRNDDPSALSDAVWERRVLECFLTHGIVPVWGIIPFVCQEVHDPFCNECHPLEENAAMVGLIREAVKKGWIHPAMHGVTHRTNRLFGGRRCDDSGDGLRSVGSRNPDVSWKPCHPQVGFAEFNGLPESFIIDRLREGKLYLQSLLGKPIDTFIFPWNSLDQTALNCLAQAGFKHVLAGRRFFHWQRKLEPIVYRDCEDVFCLDEVLKTGPGGLIQVVVHTCAWNETDLKRFDAMLARCRDKGMNLHWIRLPDLFGRRRFKEALFWGRFIERMAVSLERYWDGRWKVPVFYRMDFWRETPLALKMIGVWLLHKKLGYKKTAVVGAVGLLVLGVFVPMLWPGVIVLTVLMLVVLGAYALKTRRQREAVWRSYQTSGLKERGEDEVSWRWLRLKTRPEDVVNYQWLRRRYPTSHGLDEEKRELLLCGAYLNEDRAIQTVRYFYEKYRREGKDFLAYVCGADWVRRDPIGVPNEVLETNCPPPPPAPSWDRAQPGVSVVVLAGRDTFEIYSALDSLLKQTFNDFEVVLVDNTPSGLALDRLKVYKDRLRIKYVRTASYLPAGMARNEGLRHITREWVVFLDDDDIYYPDHLERFWGLKNESPFLYTGLVAYRGRLNQGRFEPNQRLFVWNDILDVRTLSQAWRQGTLQVMMRRDLFSRHGMFRVDFCPAEDSELFGRFYREHRAVFTGEVTCEYRLKEDNVTLSNRLFNHTLGRWVSLHCGSFESDLPRATAYHLKRMDDRGLYESIRERVRRGHFIDIAGVADLLILAHAKDDGWVMEQVLNQFDKGQIRQALVKARSRRRGLSQHTEAVSQALAGSRLALRLW